MKKLLQTELLLLDMLNTSTLVGNLSERVAGISSEPAWVQNLTCRQQLRALL